MEVLLQNIITTRAEHAEIAPKIEAANKSLSDIDQKIASLKAQIASADTRYEKACLERASGRSADPGAILAEQADLKSQVCGFEQVRDAQAAEVQPLAERLFVLSRAIDAQLELEQEAELSASHANIARALKAAEAAYSTAQRDFRLSLQKVSEFNARKVNRASYEQRRQRQNG